MFEWNIKSPNITVITNTAYALLSAVVECHDRNKIRLETANYQTQTKLKSNFNQIKIGEIYQIKAKFLYRQKLQAQ